jgi:hypothetical protein
MILGKPTLQSVLDLIDAEGCPHCGEPAGTIFVDGPNEILLEGCGHVVDATGWIDEGELGVENGQ